MFLDFTFREMWRHCVGYRFVHGATGLEAGRTLCFCNVGIDFARRIVLGEILMVRSLVVFLTAVLLTSCLQAQIVSNPVLTTFTPYASSGYVTTPGYVPATAIGQPARPVVTYRVPVTGYYAAPPRVITYRAPVAPARVVYRMPVAPARVVCRVPVAPSRVAYRIPVAPARVVYRVPVTGPPTGVITYRAPANSFGTPVQSAPTYYRPAYRSPTGLSGLNSVVPATSTAATGCGCGAG